MRTAFHEELDLIRDRLQEMGRLTSTAVQHANRALMETDLSLAEGVIGADDQIDDIRRDLDARTMDLIARQQPVARDLRTLITAMRMSSDLERMGDLARHVAKVARLRYPQPVVPASLRDTFTRMGQVAEGMIAHVEVIVASNDLQGAAKMQRLDDEMDDLHRDVFRWVLAESWEGGIQGAIDATLLSRYYERFGDHAVVVAQRVVYLVTGEWYDENELEERLDVRADQRRASTGTA